MAHNKIHLDYISERRESQMREDTLKIMLDKASKKKPVTRDEIRIKFMVSDRVGRKLIENLRDKGIRVCGQSDGDGYWIAKTQAEYERFRMDYVSRATTILRRANNMDNQTDEGQVSMIELL